MEGGLQLPAGELLLLGAAVRRDEDRLTVHEDSSSERQGDQKPIPGRQEFFFEQEKETGMMGAPLILAAAITPG